MPEEFQPAWHEQLIETAAEPARQNVGGWLMFFCVTCIVFAPISLISATVKASQLYWVITYLVLLVCTVSAGLATSFRLESAFTLIRLTLLMRLVYALTQLAFGVYLCATDPQSSIISREFAQATGNALHVAIWFWYFKVSSRVKLTFGRNI